MNFSRRMPRLIGGLSVLVFSFFIMTVHAGAYTGAKRICTTNPFGHYRVKASPSFSDNDYQAQTFHTQAGSDLWLTGGKFAFLKTDGSGDPRTFDLKLYQANSATTTTTAVATWTDVEPISDAFNSYTADAPFRLLANTDYTLVMSGHSGQTGVRGYQIDHTPAGSNAADDCGIQDAVWQQVKHHACANPIHGMIQNGGTCVDNNTSHVMWRFDLSSDNGMVSTTGAASIGQFEDDSTTALTEGATNTSDTVIIKGAVISITGTQVKLEVEIRPIGMTFSSTSTHASSYVNSGSATSITIPSLGNGDYHWRYRAVAINSNTSAWIEFGAGGNSDFSIHATVAPPTLSDLGQFRVDASDTESAIEEGKMLSDDTLRIKGVPTSSSGGQVKLEVEVKKLSAPFDGTGLQASALFASGTTVSKDIQITLSSPSTEHGPYHWRARAVDGLGNVSEWMEFGTAGNKDFQRAFKVGVIFASIAGEPSTTPIVTYRNIVSRVEEYFKKNTYDKVAFDLDSFGNDGSWVVMSGSKSSYAANISSLVEDAFVATDLDTDAYDVVIIVHSGVSRQSSGDPADIPTLMRLHTGNPIRIIVAEDDRVGGWSHELTHALGILTTDKSTAAPDLYSMGSIGRWDLMASGDHNGGQNNSEGTIPALMGSYTRDFLGLLDDSNPHPLRDFGSHRITALADSAFNAEIFRYNLVDTSSTATPRYYLMEVRDRTLSEWDSALPPTQDESDEHLVLYYVDTRGIPEYGYAHGGTGIPLNMFRTVTIPGNSIGAIGNDGLLKDGETYSDYNNFVRFTASSAPPISGKHGMDVNISEMTLGLFDSLMIGGVHIPYNHLLQRQAEADSLLDFGYTDASGTEHQIVSTRLQSTNPIAQFYSDATFSILGAVILLIAYAITLIALRKTASAVRKRRLQLLSWMLLGLAVILLAITVATPILLRNLESSKEVNSRTTGLRTASPDTSSPDLDLHVSCDDGRHVGMNYVTGEYEIGIADTITNGDNQGAPEWIFFPPEGNESCRHSVSAHDNEVFLQENPDIAAAIGSATDTYEIYARYIDPASGIFTSATLADQVIEPGAVVEHEVSGTSDVAIGEGVVDTTSPDTVVDAGPIESTTSTSATFSFHATEGGAAFQCALDGGAFLTCASPATYSALADGSHLFEVFAADPSGNEDASRATHAWQVDTTAPSVAIASPEDGLLTNQPLQVVTVTAADPGVGLASVAVNGVACVLDAEDWTCADVPLSEGLNTLEATATDRVGNAGTASISITLDTAAPVIEEATATPHFAGVNASVSVEMRVTDAVGATGVTVSLKGPNPSTASVASLALTLASGTPEDGTWSGTVHFPAQSQAPDGSYVVEAQVSDASGNAHAAPIGSLSLDRSAPEIQAVTVSPAAQRPGHPVQVSVTASDLSSGIASVTVRDVTAGGPSVPMTQTGGSVAAGETSSWEHAYQAALPEGPHMIEVTITDNEGNASTQGGTVTVDATLPTVTLDLAPSGTTGPAPEPIAFHADEPSTFACRLDGGAWTSCESPAHLANLADGPHGFDVRAEDAAGNTSAIAHATWTVDAIAPTVTLDSVPPPTTTQTSAAVSFHASETSSFACRLDAGAWTACTSPKTYTSLPIGPHTIDVRATDAVQNVGNPASASFEVLGVLTFPSVADTYLRSGAQNQNEGTEGFLRLQAAGDNRGLVRFDVAAIASAIGPDAAVVSASLGATIVENGDNWGPSGRTVDAHRLTASWTETGATWNCANDTNVANHQPDCPTSAWTMGNLASTKPWVTQASGTALISNQQSGAVSFNVTNDLQTFLAGTPNTGWLLRKTNENAAGLVKFGSRETQTPPVLTVTYRRP